MKSEETHKNMKLIHVFVDERGKARHYLYVNVFQILFFFMVF